ncbi:MAG: hypothetical protein M1820_005323 [Bogoriella megaspora]|nr:MAG: hypothetical protein M1820_005323 [Bogoriella megaspora]
MNFFKRKQHSAEPTSTAPHEKRGRKGPWTSSQRSTVAPTDDGSYNKRPPFGQWLKATLLDILTMVVMGVIGLGIYEAHPAPSRSFPVYFRDGEVVYPEFAYPLRHEIVPIWLAALLGSLVPIFIILCMQIHIRSFWDANNAIIGLLYSLITAAVFQVFLKWLIGGLRPHFLDVCKPVVTQEGQQTGNGFGAIMYDRKICTGNQDQIDDSLESFPSGHSTAAFAGFVFLYLYLNAKLKVWSNYHPAFWKLIVTYMPILGATLIAGALTIDEFHNWYDVLAGGIIGTVMAFSAYRMVYASVWDFRFNHVPLLRHAPFTYGEGSGAFAGFHDAIFTRKAGWGTPLEGSGWGGAPGDAGTGFGHTGFGHTGYGGGAAGIATPARGNDAYGGTGHEQSGRSIERRPVGGHRAEQMV